MQKLKPEFLIRSLQTLTNKKEHIQTLSLFIRTNKKSYKTILEICIKEFYKSNSAHKLNLLYLMNEILLTEKSKDETSSHLTSGLANLLPEFIKAVKDSEDHQIQLKAKELERIWVEFNILPKDNKDDKKDIKRIKVESDSHIKVFEANKEFTKENVLEMVSNCFEERQKLIKYLKEFIKSLEKEKTR